MKCGIDDSGFDWVAHPNSSSTDKVEMMLVERRTDIEVLGGIVDDDLSYEYDEFALIKLDGDYYLLETSGCSCPSPTETWTVIEGPSSLSQIRDVMTSGKYQGYTLPAKKLKDFLELIDSNNN